MLAAITERQDRDAFAKLYRHFAPKVKAFACRMGVDQSAADEIAQEVMLSVWRRAHSYQPAKASASTWIYAIARNRVIDGMRQRKRAVVDPNDPAFEPAPEPDPDDRLDAKHREKQLHDAMKDLPSEQAEILRISYFEGKSQSSIAEQLDVPLGTVKSRARLALARLRTSLAEDS